MGKITYLKEEDLNMYSNIEELKTLNSVEDVATLLDVFNEARKSIDFKNIVSVCKDDSDFYYLVVSNTKGNFDLFEFINNSFDNDTKINCLNANYLYPKRLSRGIYDDEDFEEDDDNPTSFLGDSSLPFEDVTYKLVYKSHGMTVEIPKQGLNIGRSIKKADFIIKDNKNVGRVHCNIYIDDNGRLMIHDYDSLNGTFVNSKKVISSNDVQVQKGDIIYLADEEFEIE